ncbi:MAG: copper homeostasis protein CutC [Lentisphaerota bacterium]
MQKQINLEVCVDNIESVDISKSLDVQRLELCGALALGGLTPSPSLIRYARKNTSISLHSMIRPRAGDFCFSDKDVDTMLCDIEVAYAMGAHGVVIGILNNDFTINTKAVEKMVAYARKLSLDVTFHRAFDFVPNVKVALEFLIGTGVRRILTSGTKSTALEGIEIIRELNALAAGRIEIMAGSGVNAGNVLEIIRETSVRDIHTSAGEKVNKFADRALKLGADSSDLSYQRTSYEKLMAVKSAIVHSIRN